MDEAGPSDIPSSMDTAELEALPPAPDADDLPPPSDQPAQPELSKNQRKKLAKQEAWLAHKLAKRKSEKEKKKRAAAERRARIEAGVEDELDRAPKKRRKEDDQQPAFGATIVMDCAFDELMTEKEVSSLRMQLVHSYSVNRYAHTPFARILITSLSGRLEDRFKTVYHSQEHLGWKRVSFSTRSWQDLASDEAAPDTESLRKEDVVYLTADSPNVLEELDESKVYIIGALVDRNRYKNICLNRAIEAGVAHAQLPFGQYMSELKTRRVLTVNQVLDILCHWLSNRDWRGALEAVVPTRKFRDGGTAAGADQGEVVGEDEDGES